MSTVKTKTGKAVKAGEKRTAMKKQAVKETKMVRLTRWMVARYFPGMAIYKKVNRPKGIRRKKPDVQNTGARDAQGF